MQYNFKYLTTEKNHTGVGIEGYVRHIPMLWQVTTRRGQAPSRSNGINQVRRSLLGRYLKSQVQHRRLWHNYSAVLYYIQVAFAGRAVAGAFPTQVILVGRALARADPACHGATANHFAVARETNWDVCVGVRGRQHKAPCVVAGLCILKKILYY